MSKDIPETLFGSRVRVKILKLILRNSERSFDIREIASRIQEPSSSVKQEVKRLLSVKLLRAGTIK